MAAEKDGPMRSYDTKLVIVRTFDTPVTLVWKAWSDPAMLALWWSPKAFTTPTVKMDFRVGGKYHFCMRPAEGQDFWSTGVYEEIVPLKKIVFTDSFADENGNIVPASHYGLEGDFTEVLLVSVEFREENGKTIMTLTHFGMPAGEMSEMANDGWNQFFDKLVDALQSSR